MNCKHCGAPLIPGDRFCGNCGKPAEASEERKPKAPVPPAAKAAENKASGKTDDLSVWDELVRDSDRDIYSSSPAKEHKDLFDSVFSEPAAKDVPSGSSMPPRAPQPGNNGMPPRTPQPGNNGMPPRAPQPGNNGMPPRTPQPGNNGMPPRTPQPGNNGIPPRDPGSGQYRSVQPQQKSGSGSKIAVIAAAAAAVLLVIALVVCAFSFHWFGLDFDALFGGKEEPATTAAAESTTSGTDLPVTTTTVPTTEIQTFEIPEGTPEKPVQVSGERSNVAGHIQSANLTCVYAFTPTKTGYYYIQVPDAQKRLQFKVYNGSTENLMGSAEYQNSGKQMLFYNMFFAGKKYLVYVTASQEQDITASFVDHTGDKNRIVRAGEKIKMETPYTYLRKFTPESSGEYRMTLIVTDDPAAIALYDKNWNPISFQLYVDDQSFDDAYYFFTMDYQAGTEYNFIVTPGSNSTFYVEKVS